jgi:hypothetical protein
LFCCHELFRDESDSVDELVIEQAFAFSVGFRQDITDMLKMSLTVGQPTSGIKLGKYFKVKVTLAKLFDVLVYQLG